MWKSAGDVEDKQRFIEVRIEECKTRQLTFQALHLIAVKHPALNKTYFYRGDNYYRPFFDGLPFTKYT